MSDDIWEVYAVRYAEHQRKAAENYIGGDPHDVLQPLDYFVWVIKNDKRTFLVDTGFDQPVGTKRGRTVITPIDQGLKRLGIEPDKVEDIIISHMHYDHCGNVDMFPRARYHVQDKEMDVLHRPLHVPQAAPHLVRRGLRRLDGAQAVRRPRHLP